MKILKVMALSAQVLLVFACLVSIHGIPTLPQIDEGIRLAQERLNVIYNRYELFKPIGEAFFLMQHNLSPQDFELLKLQFTKKMSHDISSYIMLFGGTSVTAGHDNSISQAYPRMIEKLMRPMLSAVNINLTVYNIAQGANGCLPSDWCYSSMGSYKADVIGWEQTFNCYDKGIFDLMHRTAFWSKNDDIGSIYIAASGSGSTSQCNETDFGKPYSDENWTPSDASLPNWLPNRTALSSWKNRLRHVYKKNGRTFREAIFENYQPSGIALSAFRFSQKYDLAYCKSIFGDNHRKDKPNYVFHSSNRPSRWSCEPEKIYQKCAIKFLRKEASVYGQAKRKKNHHPPRAHHMMRAEFFVFHYGMAFLESLYSARDMILRHQASVEMTQISNLFLTDYQTALASAAPKHSSELPPSLGKHFAEGRPICYTDYRPHYNADLTLTGQIVGWHNWTIQSLALRPVPDKTFYEKRPGIVSPTSSVSSELFLDIKINDSSKHVAICSYMGKLDPRYVKFRLDLHVSDDRLRSYTPLKTQQEHHEAGNLLYQHNNAPPISPMYDARSVFDKEGRVVWANVSYENSCLFLFDVPAGQHVLGTTVRHPHVVVITHMLYLR